MNYSKNFTNKGVVMRKLVLALIIACSVSGCNDPRKAVLPSDLNSEEGTKFAEKIKKLPEQDKELLAGYILRKEMAKAFGSSTAPVGVTVQQAIDEQKAWVDKTKAEEKAKKEQADRLKAEKNAKVQEAKAALNVIVFDKQIIAGDFDKKLVLSFEFANKTNKKIDGVKGVVNFKNKFGDDVRGVGISEPSLTIEPNQSVKIDLSKSINEFISEDRTFAETQLKDLTYEFIPEQILFEDGSKIVMPN